MTTDKMIDALQAAMENLRAARAAACTMQASVPLWLHAACGQKIAEIDELMTRTRAVITGDSDD